MISIDYKNKLHFWLFAALFVFSLLPVIITGEYFWIAIPFGILVCYSAWQNISIVFFLLLATLPFSTEYHFNPGLGTDIPDEFLMLITTATFILYFSNRPTAVSKNYLFHPLLILLIFSVMWILVAAFFSTDILVSVKFFLAKCWYIGAFVLTPLILFRKEKTIKTSAVIVAISMLIVTLIILIRHAQYDFRFADINNAVQPLFRNHVNYSAMLVCIIPLFFAFFHLSNSIRNKFFITIAVFVLLTALFFSYSRGAWVALLAGLIAYWLIRKKLLVISFLAAFILAIGFLFWIKSNDRYVRYAPDFATTIFHKNFEEHLIATYKLKDVSTEERFYRWIAGVRMIKDNWVTGYGPNTFYYNYKPYAAPVFKTWVSDNKEHSTVHNYFLLMTIEQGIPGLILFLLLVGGMLYYAQRLYHKKKNRFYKTVAATTGVIITMLIIVNFLSDLVETDKIGSIFFLCLAVLIVCDVRSKQASDLSSDVQGVS